MDCLEAQDWVWRASGLDARSAAGAVVALPLGLSLYKQLKRGSRKPSKYGLSVDSINSFFPLSTNTPDAFNPLFSIIGSRLLGKNDCIGVVLD